jgi:tetratricopeptide (TPR) repeat protein
LRRGLEIWERRDRLTARDLRDAHDPAAEQVRTDLLDLATICAGLQVHAADAGGRRAGLHAAVALLNAALRQYGPSPALVRDLRSYATALGSADGSAVAVPAPRSAWEHYDLGRSYLRSGEFARAEEQFRHSADQQPGEFWTHFFLGVCARRLDRPADAVVEFSICVALAPRTAECYFNRGVACEANGQPDRALADYSRALALDPQSADAALNRGILKSQRGDLSGALGDLERARTATSRPQVLGLIWYHLGLVHLARNDPAAARRCLFQALALGHEPARAVKARLDPH